MKTRPIAISCVHQANSDRQTDGPTDLRTDRLTDKAAKKKASGVTSNYNIWLLEIPSFTSIASSTSTISIIIGYSNLLTHHCIDEIQPETNVTEEEVIGDARTSEDANASNEAGNNAEDQIDGE